ncbi:restriction endonuclease subunit S [Emergencia sp. 1XD21-10]|uniref:restriction endonuclease subunit S n=1 Tax=Emergencia sp. 1XD21-10 TaxID=2304569 RepID=UPI00137B5D91|nr:restriction endonuclease subunit S [Emergencia sp. 1XD21-10]NCE98343.1 restriction endonuclease subunit S [Emergencia sp. 1XD21-10]
MDRIRLGTLTRIRTGKLDANASSENGEFPFFTCAMEPLKIDAYSYDCECVLVAGNGDLNVKYYDGKFDAYQRTYIIESTDKERIIVPYIYYFLEGYIDTLRGQSIGGIIKYIKLANLTDAQLLVPSVSEQKKIVSILESAKAIIHHYKIKTEKLDELVKARFVELFGDPVLNDKKFLTVLGDSFFKLSNGKAVSEKKRYKAGIPAYGGNGISWFTDKPLIADDTLVVGRVGFQSGNVHYAEGPLWITDNAMYISKYDKDKFNLMFLCDLMQHIDFSRFQDAGDLKKITQKPFMNFRYILPSMALQQQFVDFKRQVDKSKVVLERRACYN